MMNVGGVNLAKRFDFGLAIHALNSGHRVRRAGWNGKGMWLVHIPASAWAIEDISGSRIHLASGNGIERADFIAMKTADNKIVPWLASQTDMLATDWEVVQ